jgi:hypothetical protein
MTKFNEASALGSGHRPRIDASDIRWQTGIQLAPAKNADIVASKAAAAKEIATVANIFKKCMCWQAHAPVSFCRQRHGTPGYILLPNPTIP